MQALGDDEPKSVKSQVIDLAVKEGGWVHWYWDAHVCECRLRVCF